jgi:hypothetical protein
LRKKFEKDATRGPAPSDSPGRGLLERRPLHPKNFEQPETKFRARITKNEARLS